MTKTHGARSPSCSSSSTSPGSAGRVSTSPPATRSVESFEDFYRREYPRLLVLARVLAGDAAAEDLAQESMLAAYRQWTQIAVWTARAATSAGSARTGGLVALAG